MTFTIAKMIYKDESPEDTMSNLRMTNRWRFIRFTINKANTVMERITEPGMIIRYRLSGTEKSSLDYNYDHNFHFSVITGESFTIESLVLDFARQRIWQYTHTQNDDIVREC